MVDEPGEGGGCCNEFISSRSFSSAHLARRSSWEVMGTTGGRESRKKEPQGPMTEPADTRAHAWGCSAANEQRLVW